MGGGDLGWCEKQMGGPVVGGARRVKLQVLEGRPM